MAAGDTDLSICSDALIMLGAAPISSFTEGTDAAQACDRLYPDLRDSLLSRYPWSWTYRKVQLSRLATAPLNEFEHAYQLPGNILSGVQAVFETTAANQQPINDVGRSMGISFLQILRQSLLIIKKQSANLRCRFILCIFLEMRLLQSLALSLQIKHQKRIILGK